MAISRSQIRETHYQLSNAQSSRLLTGKINNQRVYLWMKRSIDLFGALAGLIILMPVFLIVALLIKLDDPKGKVLFKQVRIGKGGKTFYIYKFRSMVTNAEQLLNQLLDQNETTGAMFKIKKRSTSHQNWTIYQENKPGRASSADKRLKRRYEFGWPAASST